MARLHVESKAIAGMLSLLPAEVDVEAQIKQHIFGELHAYMCWQTDIKALETAVKTCCDQ